MKSLRPFMILLMLMLFMPVVSGSGKSQKRKARQAKVAWEYVGKTGSEYWCRSSRTGHRTSNGFFVMWFRIAAPAPDMEYAFRTSSRMHWSEALEENGHSLQLWEFNCPSGQMRACKTSRMTEKGRSLRSIRFATQLGLTRSLIPLARLLPRSMSNGEMKTCEHSSD